MYDGVGGSCEFGDAGARAGAVVVYIAAEDPLGRFFDQHPLPAVLVQVAGVGRRSAGCIGVA